MFSHAPMPKQKKGPRNSGPLTLSGFLNAQRSTQLYAAFSWPSGNQATSPFWKPPARVVRKGTSHEIVSFAICKTIGPVSVQAQLSSSFSLPSAQTRVRGEEQAAAIFSAPLGCDAGACRVKHFTSESLSSTSTSAYNRKALERSDVFPKSQLESVTHLCPELVWVLDRGLVRLLVRVRVNVRLGVALQPLGDVVRGCVSVLGHGRLGMNWRRRRRRRK